MTTELLGVLQEIVKNYMNAIKMTDKATGTVIFRRQPNPYSGKFCIYGKNTGRAELQL